MDKAFEEFGCKIQALDESSFNTYAPLVDGICTGTASEAEVEYLLDCLLGMCNDDRLLGLFKRVCRAYFGWLLQKSMRIRNGMKAARRKKINVSHIYYL